MTTRRALLSALVLSLVLASTAAAEVPLGADTYGHLERSAAPKATGAKTMAPGFCGWLLAQIDMLDTAIAEQRGNRPSVSDARARAAARARLASWRRMREVYEEMYRTHCGETEGLGGAV